MLRLNTLIGHAVSVLALLSLLSGLQPWLEASVRREIQNWYVQQYQNKTMFLKIPVHGNEQTVQVNAGGPVIDRSSAAQALFFKVGDQVRIQRVEFRGNEIRFRISSIDTAREAELRYRFPTNLEDDFPQRAAFDVTLEGTLTEGLDYAEVDSAKETYINRQFSQFVDQLARTSDTSHDSVVRIMSRNLPDYQTLQENLAGARKELGQTEAELQDEKTRRQELQSELTRSERELDSERTQLQTIRAERDRVSKDLEGVQRRAGELQQNTENYQAQISELVKDLNVRTSSATSLGAQVNILNESIQSLRAEQTARTRELRDLNDRVQDLQQANQKLDADLKKTRDEKDNLWKDFSALTSNRQSLEARYIEMKQDNERLANVIQLDSGFRLSRRTESRENQDVHVLDLYLLEQHLGSFEMETPPQAGTVHQVRFRALSPESVKFSDEERKLYELLGEGLKVETAWESHSAAMKLVLLDKDSVQTAGPRETIEWPWMFQGELSQPETATLLIHLVSPDGRKIFLGSQDVTVTPANLVARLRHMISPISVLAGALIATLFLVTVFGIRGRSRPASGRAPSGNELVVQKRL